METVNIRWNVELETWFVAELEQNNETATEAPQWLPFDEWASNLKW